MVSAMHASDQHGAAGDVADAEPVLAPEPELAARSAVVRRAAAALAWMAGGGAVFTLLLLITRGGTLSSDPSNQALQAWDLLHGNLWLHGWILGDVTFYTFELPLTAVLEAFFGLHPATMDLALALIYLAVAVCAVAVAVTDSRGASRAARAGVSVAVLSAPILVASDRWVPLGLPDHTGTTVFVLVSVLLIDRALSWRWTPPLLCLILSAGQLSDVTVRYVAVPAIAVVCLYRTLEARRIRTADTASLVGAVLSIPLSLAIRRVMLHFGAYLMVTPNTSFAPVSAWSHNLSLTWHALRTLFGQVSGATAPPASAVTAVFGTCCMLAVAAGLARVVWRWRSASRAEQLLTVLIVISIGSYAVSTLPQPESQHDIVTVLVAGAVLAARALVPARIGGPLLAVVACVATAVVALLPLSTVAAQAKANSGRYPALTAWLHDHGLNYGLADYWYSSVISLESGDQVEVRSVKLTGSQITQYAWEMDSAWYDPDRNDATFILIAKRDAALGQAAIRIFGRPVSEHRVQGIDVLVYNKNLLEQVKPPWRPHLS